MILLDRLRRFLGISSGDPEDPVDREENWPRSAGGAARLFFPRPSDAVATVEETLAGFASGDPLPPEARIDWERSLEALRMASGDWKLRQGTGGRLARTLIEALERDPGWCEVEGLGAWVEELGEEFLRSSDRLLVLWGRALGKGLARARTQRQGSARAERRTLSGGLPAPRPWMSRRSSDLSPTLVYRLLLEDCLGDGKLTPREERTLELVAILLEIPAPRHQEMASEVEAEVRAGSLRRERPFEPRNYFQRLYFLARSGGRLSVESRELLARLGNVLGITQQEFEEIRRRVAREVQERSGRLPPPTSADQGLEVAS